MLSTVIRGLGPHIKSLYVKIFVVSTPLMLIQTASGLIKVSPVSEHWLLTYGLLLGNMLLLELVLMIVAYRIKNLLQGNTSISEVYWWFSINAFELVKISIKRILIVSLATLFLIIPGIFYAVKWFVVSPVYVFEQTGDPFTRSELLTKKRFAPILFLFFAYWAICYAYLFLLFSKDPTPEFRQIAISVLSTITWIGMLPIRGLLEYEVYSHLKSSYRDSFEDVSRYLIKSV